MIELEGLGKWKAEGKSFYHLCPFVLAEGLKLHAEGRKLCAEGYKLCAEEDKLWAEGYKLCAEVYKLCAGGQKLLSTWALIKKGICSRCKALIPGGVELMLRMKI